MRSCDKKTQNLSNTKEKDDFSALLCIILPLGWSGVILGKKLAVYTTGDSVDIYKRFFFFLNKFKAEFYLK